MKRYDFMRLIVFFDLPVKTIKDRKNYTAFRKFLIKKGFYMIQYSIYSKLLFNRDQAYHVKEAIKKSVPNNGHVRVMMITEKQYAKMEVLIGGVSNQEKVLTEDPFILI